MKKLTFVCCISILLVGLLHGEMNVNDPEDILIAPAFLASFYDSYTLNRLNSRALGMGNTSVSRIGGIANSLTNPASFKADDLTLYIEANIKNEAKEMNRYIKENDSLKEISDERQTLEAGIPAITLGLGYELSPSFSLGASFAMPQTVRYNLFGRLLKTGAYIDRFPTMINYQTTLTAVGHYKSFNVGLNLLFNYYRFNDLRIENSFDRVNFGESIFRLQPGIIYHNDLISFGLSYKLPAKKTFEAGNVPHTLYYSYDVTLPALLETGLSVSYFEKTLFALAFEYEQTSSQYKGFDDRLSIKAGIETKLPNYDLRFGLISFSDIYSGKHHHIITTRPDDDPFEFEVTYDYLQVADTSQLLATAGITYYLPNVDFSIALAKDMLGNGDIFQFSLAFDIKFGQILKETAEKRYQR